MDIYLDNAATTKISDVALEKMIYMSKTNFANPSSIHKAGLLAEREIKEARETIANTINAKEDEIIFTSGATEANNLAIIGTAFAYKRSGNHIITQKTEHSSVLESVKYLEENGFSISYLDNDNNGQINFEQLESLITENTIMVSLMHVNNETGAILDIEKIAKIIKAKNKSTLFHTDCVQSLCKLHIDVSKFNIDLLSFSGHKLQAPKGVGGLYIKKGTKIISRQFGGSQQNKIRPGTENIIGITALSESIKYLNERQNEHYKYVENLKNSLIGVEKEIEEVYINSNKTSPYILNISFKGVKAEVLVHALEEKNIFCSTGSACHKGVGSQILKNYGLDKEVYESGIRISFSSENTLEEIDVLKAELKEIIPMLRRFKKR